MWSEPDKVTITLVDEPSTTSAGPLEGECQNDGVESEELEEGEEETAQDQVNAEEEEETAPHRVDVEEEEDEDEEETESDDDLAIGEHDPDKPERPKIVSSGRSETKGRTFHYKYFSVPDSTSLRSFYRYLRGLDGKRRSPREAKQISIDLSKYLYYASNGSTISWECLVKPNTIERYLNRLEADGIGHGGRLTKLQRIGMGINFLLVGTEISETEMHQLTKMEKRIKTWESVLRKEQQEYRMEREQELAENPADITGFQMLFENSNMQAIEDLVSEAALEGGFLSNKEINMVASYLFALLMYGNSQRPGPVLGLTTEMYMKRKTAVEDGATYTIVKVKRTNYCTTTCKLSVGWSSQNQWHARPCQVNTSSKGSRPSCRVRATCEANDCQLQRATSVAHKL